MIEKTKIIEKIKTTWFGKLFTISEYIVQLPNGTKATFYIRDSEDFSIVIPILDSGEYVMTTQHRVGGDFISLEFPMGSVAGKKAEEMAKEELQQETGYTAQSFKYIGSFYPNSSTATSKANVFVATGLKEGTRKLEPTENIEVSLMEFEEIIASVRDGKIKDGPTLGALGIYMSLYGNKAVNMR